MTDTGLLPVARHAPSGRPLGPRETVCPSFTIWRVAHGLSCDELAQRLTRRGARTSGRAVRYWEEGELSPNEEQISKLADEVYIGGRTPGQHASAKQEQWVAEWFGLSLNGRRA